MRINVLVIQNRTGAVVLGIGDYVVYVNYAGIIVVESITVHRRPQINLQVGSYDVMNMKVCDAVSSFAGIEVVKLDWDVNIRKLMDDVFYARQQGGDTFTKMRFKCDIVGIGHHIAACMY